MTTKIEKKRVLVVEGTHEALLIHELMRARDLPVAEIQIMAIGGKDKLDPNLQALIRDPAFPDVVALGIVRDADYPNTGAAVSAAQSAWDAVLGCLRNASLPVPAVHGSLTVGSRQTGVFIMPDGKADGMLETLCVASVSTKPEFACVRDYFTCLSQHKITPVAPDKAQAHAFIASRPIPDVHVGVAARNGNWELDSPAFDGIVRFIQSLLAVRESNGEV